MKDPVDAPAEPAPRESLSATLAGPESGGSIPSSFLAEPADLTLPTLEEGVPWVPTQTPSGGTRYAVGSLLGRGGMASVYRAFDRLLEREVALKVLNRAHAEPYLREARSQARVRHDNVLEVYEAGELDGRPYIAMRYVDGPTLLGLKGLPLEAQLQLLAEVAEGLHAAHRAGLLHRDVKPSNVLVERGPDGQLKPYVADFGIATSLAPGGAGEASRAGTPAYMAPEQRLPDGVVDRRMDVFALGATACELLTGALPSPDQPLDGLLAPLPPDVAAIVRKCLARDPSERYPSARAVAEDLHRFLDGEVAEAHAASLAYRLTKVALRHRVLLLVSGVAAVLLLAALVVAAILGGMAMRANQRAETRRKQAEDLIGFMLGDLRKKLQPRSSLALLDDVGKKALQYFAAVPRAELSLEELSRRAKALYQIGDVRISQGDLEGAKAPLHESLALAEELVRRDPAALGPLFELGQSYFWVGFVDWKQGRFEEAARRFEAYLDLSRRLVARQPKNPDYTLELHYATSNLGSLRESEGRLSQAIANFREALAIIERLVAKNPKNADWQFELAAAHNKPSRAAAGDRALRGGPGALPEGSRPARESRFRPAGEPSGKRVPRRQPHLHGDRALAPGAVRRGAGTRSRGGPLAGSPRGRRPRQCRPALQAGHRPSTVGLQRAGSGRAEGRGPGVSTSGRDDGFAGPARLLQRCVETAPGIGQLPSRVRVGRSKPYRRTAAQSASPGRLRETRRHD